MRAQSQNRGGERETHRWQRSPLMPLVVQKHLPLLGLHMLAWPLHLQAEPKTRNMETVLKKHLNKTTFLQQHFLPVVLNNNPLQETQHVPLHVTDMMFFLYDPAVTGWMFLASQAAVRCSQFASPDIYWFCLSPFESNNKELLGFRSVGLDSVYRSITNTTKTIPIPRQYFIWYLALFTTPDCTGSSCCGCGPIISCIKSKSACGDWLRAKPHIEQHHQPQRGPHTHKCSSLHRTTINCVCNTTLQRGDSLFLRRKDGKGKKLCPPIQMLSSGAA